MKEADEIIVTDTGSTDQTVEKLKQLGATVYSEKIEPWRFDEARNISLEHVPLDCDICVCTDLDELFEPGWRASIEKVWNHDTKQGRYLYNWSLLEDGTPYVQINYFKIHTRKDFKWIYPIHEIITYTGEEPYHEVFIDGIILNHYPDIQKPRGSYIGLLEMAVDENPKDDRMMHYLGREYMYKGKWQESIETLKKHLKLESAVWCEERSASMRYIAYSYSKMNQIKEAYAWYLRAIAEILFMREPYVDLAKLAYEQKDFETMYFATNEALRIKEKSAQYANEGYAWDFTVEDMAANGAFHIGLFEKAHMFAKEAMLKNPIDERMKKNIKSIEQHLKNIN